ncbi:MAG TPA: peptide MFS transporter [Sphingobacteriaceae bacterium]
MNQTATAEVQKGHPKGLYVLFMTEMWERFSYYGMRALLILYLTAQLVEGGFELTRENALEIYAIFTGLVYLTPIVGGLLADKVLGQRKAIFIGGILMALGQFTLAASQTGNTDARTWLLYLGLGVLIVGNGFFKPNISTIVGKLYTDHDPRKDSAFTIFYMGINLGAFLAPLACGYLAAEFGWAYGFGAAGVGMLLGTLWFAVQGRLLGNVGFSPKTNTDVNYQLTLKKKDWIDILLYVVACLVIVYGFLTLWGGLSEGLKSTLTTVLAVIGGLALLYIIFSNTKGSVEWKRVGVIFVLCFFNIFFWAGFEQAGGTFNLFAEHNTNRNLFGWEIPAAWFQSVNSIWIIALAPVISALWLTLSRVGKNPNIPVKFAMALILLGLGFVVMSTANAAAQGGNMVSPMWLVMVYFLHTVAELCLSPIGLSMISKLSPQKIVSVMMGLWFASIALANYMAGVLEAVLKNYLPDMELFNFLTLTSIVAGVILLILSPILKRLMSGVS